MQILEEQQIGDLRCLCRRIDAGANLMTSLAAAVQRRGVHIVTCFAQAFRDRLPDPATLVRTMDQNEGGHCHLLRLYPLAGIVIEEHEPSMASHTDRKATASSSNTAQV